MVNTSGEAVLLPQYIATAEQTPVEELAGTKRSSSEDQCVPEPKKARGAFKKRNQKNNDYLRSIPRLCSYVAIDQPCPREKCSFSHDLIEFLASKPELLSLNCPYSSLSPSKPCPYGHSCLCSDHINSPLTSPDLTPIFSTNHISGDLKFQLQKKQYFSATLDPIESNPTPASFLDNDKTLWLAPLATLGMLNYLSNRMSSCFQKALY
ncbi:hypothetical protein RCL1_006054 [Eukaryota sp. TZLM3-RCL]